METLQHSEKPVEPSPRSHTLLSITYDRYLVATAAFSVTTGSNSTEILSIYGDSVVFINLVL